MGYDVHITRKKEWSDKKGPKISLAEWIALVKADPDMRLDGYAEAELEDGSILRVENEGLSVWTAYSRHGEKGNMAWFDFHRGNVDVKNPDLEILQKMWSLAQALSAKVQGDDGEFYDASGIQLGMPAQVPVTRSWWRFW
jgi:prepilin-type processing-associated H-X9-DG protein